MVCLRWSTRPFLRPVPSMKSKGKEVPHPLRLLHAMYKKTADKRGVPWLAAPPALTHRRSLPQAAPSRYQVLPTFPDIMEDLQKTWHVPLSARVPLFGYSLLDMEGMEASGDQMPLVKPSLANELAPSSSSAALAPIAPKLPHRVEHLYAALWEKVYRLTAQSGRALNAAALLKAYLATHVCGRFHRPCQKAGPLMKPGPNQDGHGSCPNSLSVYSTGYRQGHGPGQ